MSAGVDFARARRALPITFAIYVLEAVLAAVAALPSAVELRRIVPARLARDLDAALLLDGLGELAAVLRVLRMELGLSLLMTALLGAWLQMAWFASMRRELTFTTALLEGAQRAGRALRVSGLVVALFVLLALPFVGVGYLAHRRLQADARTHDLALVGALAPLLALGFLAYVLHDLARANALSRGAFASVRRALSRLRRPRVVAYALAFAIGGGLLLSVGQLAAAALPEGLAALSIGALLLQLSVLGRLYLRSLWLTCALAQSEPPAPPGVREHEPVRTD